MVKTTTGLNLIKPQLQTVLNYIYLDAAQLGATLDINMVS